MGKKKKSRTDSEIQKVMPSSLIAKMAKEDTSLEGLKEHRVVPRLKIIQGSSGQELRDQFGAGSVIIRPGDQLVCHFAKDSSMDDQVTSFQFVPLFFFVEFAKWQDLKSAGQGANVITRTFDDTSEVAKRCRNKDLRFELYEGHGNLPEAEQRYYRYVEHFRFVGCIYGDHILSDVPVVLSFERGEFGQGKNFISAASLRRVQNEGEMISVPLWMQVWEFSTIYHDPTPDKKWYGFRFSPAPLIETDHVAKMKERHEEFKSLFQKQRLTVDESGETDQDAKETTSEEF